MTSDTVLLEPKREEDVPFRSYLGNAHTAVFRDFILYSLLTLFPTPYNASCRHRGEIRAMDQACGAFAIILVLSEQLSSDETK